MNLVPRLRMIRRLSGLSLLVFLVLAGLSTNLSAQVPWTVPIYINPTDFTSNRYTIYASVDGTVKPYLFDTGSPNLFTVFNAQTPGSNPTGNFTFANGDTYNYYLTETTIGLHNQAGTLIVQTANPAGIARVSSISSHGNPANTTNSTTGLPDGTWGDFGAGFYGNSTLSTILTQVPLAPGLQPGYKLDLTPFNGLTQGTLALGLTTAEIQAAKATPGAITMWMNPSGESIPTANGSVFGYTRDQVRSTFVTLVGPDGAPTVAQTLGTVFDTGGGANAVLYSDAFDNPLLKDGNLTIQYTNPNTSETSTILNYDGQTPWPGSAIDVAATTFNNPRVNPGASIFDSYIFYFHLNEDTGSNQPLGELILVPAVPEPQFGLLLGAALLALVLLRRRTRSA